MGPFDPRVAAFEDRVRASFAAQVMARSLGLSMPVVEPGFVVLETPFTPDFVQQHGFHHAGVTTTGMDSGCGYAAFSLMEIGAKVLTVEFKTSLLAPARGLS